MHAQDLHVCAIHNAKGQGQGTTRMMCTVLVTNHATNTGVDCPGVCNAEPLMRANVQVASMCYGHMHAHRRS